MAVVNPPYAMQNASHPAALFRQVVAAEYGVTSAVVMTSPYNILFGQGIGWGAGGTYNAGGVIGPGDLVVSQHTGSDMNVSVVPGACTIPKTGLAGGGLYYATTDGAPSVVSIATSSGSNFRNDVIVATVIDTQYGGGSNTWVIQAITGSLGASAATSLAALPANSIALAVVYVGISVTAITNANITDARTFAAPGGDTGWTVISSFTNSWTQSGSLTVKCRQINRVVYVEGVLVPGSSGAAAFTLPSAVGYPAQTIYRPSFGAGSGVNMNIKIDTSGNVTPSWISGTPTTTGLGFSYPIL